MAELPKIDSEGLRLAKKLGAERVSSVTRVSKNEPEPEVQCYLCKRVFQKYVPGAAHNRNYYRCQKCLDKERRNQSPPGRK